MPSRTLPYVEPYTPAPEATEDLDYAVLPVIDLAKANTPEGRAELAKVATEAMANQGFMYVINHGYTPAQTKRMFDIAHIPFTQVSLEEKKDLISDIRATGSYQGYKLPQYWHIDNGVHDRVEHYNINHDITKRQHPEAIRPFLPEIDAFARHCHFNVIHPILRLLARGLELPEERLVELHDWNAPGESYVRFMKYYPRPEEDEIKTKNVWFKGHTDIGSVTVLWSQPVAALQILSPEGKWQWAKHVDNAIVINIGDSLEFLSGGFYKATIHRVVQPPPSQHGYPRLSLFFFGLPDDDVVLKPLVDESPVLQRVGVQKRFEEDKAPTAEVWRKTRTSVYGKSELKQEGADGAIEVQTLNGIVVKHYN